MVETIRKISLAFFFVCVCIASMIHAGNDEEFFLRGNKYYNQKEYEKALHAYNLIDKKGRAVLYNIGNCYYQQGDYSHALVYWSRAQIGAPMQEYNRIEDNKKHALKKIGNEQKQSRWHAFISLLHKIPYVPLFFLQLIFLILWWFCIGALRQRRIGIKKMIHAAMSLTMSFCAIVLTLQYIDRTTQHAIVVKKEAQLLTGPDKSFHALVPIQYAHNVAVKESRQGWHKIQYADMIGWVEADVIQVI